MRQLATEKEQQQLRHKEAAEIARLQQEQMRQLAAEKETLATENEQQEQMRREVTELRHQLQSAQAQKKRRGFFGFFSKMIFGSVNTCTMQTLDRMK